VLGGLSITIIVVRYDGPQRALTIDLLGGLYSAIT
jgi:hypothetical protein